MLPYILKMKKILKGKIDEYGLIYFNTTIINPENNKAVTEAKSIIDTGASKSHIQVGLIEYLKLISKGDTEFINPISGKVKTGIYNIEIIIDKLKIERIEVRIIDDPKYPAALIIGMDIIKMFDFSYQSESKIFEMALPSSD